MQKQKIVLVFIILLIVASLTVIKNLPLQLGLDLRGGAQLTLEIKNTKGQTITAGDLNAVKKVIENRINGLGVAEPVVQTVGEDKILVQLPGVTNPQEAEKILGGTALLEFRPQKVGTQNQFSAEYANQRSLDAQIEALRKQGKIAQEQAKFDQLQESLNKAQVEIGKLFDPPAITGKNLKDARPEAPDRGTTLWSVAIRFDETGGNGFAELTKNLAGTGRSIGIFLDNRLISAPTVEVKFAQTGITGGQAVITGNFTIQEAQELAVQLRGGSLPFPVQVVENRTIGATLGQDSIRRSIYAAIAGLVLVLLFIGIYYRLPGLVADLALLIYALLTYAAFCLVGVTMTLPGIAGFILSIGIAVDANILIFERTREELRANKTLFRAVENGFFRAFATILDTHVTTLIACGAMFWFGSGLVKGFAVTLAVGVLISIFTAVTCTRTFLMILVLGVPKLRQKPELFCPNLPAATVK
jgi:preprotein translocase subunit SecD